MALDKFQPYLFISAGEQSNKYLTPTYADGIAQFQAQRTQSLTGLTVRIDQIQEGTGDPAPDNIRPISGRTGLTVTVQGGETEREYPITWQTEAGAIYGGTLNVTTGVLTVDRICVTFTENDDWSGTGSGGSIRYYVYLPVAADRTKSGATTICSCAVYLTGNSGAWGTYNYNANSGVFTIKNGDGGAGFTSLADFKAWLSTNTLQLCYYIAEPQAYQLSPTDVQTLAGFNQIYSDAGPVIDIQF